MREFFVCPLWILSSICIAVGLLTARHYESIPPQSRADAWGRFAEIVSWYGLALIIFCGQLLFCAYRWRTRNRGWWIGLVVAFALSAGAFTVACLERFDGVLD